MSTKRHLIPASLFYALKKLFLLLLFASATSAHAHKTVWIIIHGTFAKSATWCRVGGDFYESLKSVVDPTAIIRTYVWSGKNSFPDRKKEAEELVRKIVRDYKPEDILNIIGHSHGGNLGVIVTQLFAQHHPQYRLNYLITLAPPILVSHYHPAMTHVNMVLNFYSYGDMVQTVGVFYERVYPDHERIWNIQLVHDDRCPEHGNVHPYQLAEILPQIPLRLSLENRPAVLHLRKDYNHTLTRDPRREWDLKQDRNFREQVLTMIHSV